MKKKSLLKKVFFIFLSVFFTLAVSCSSSGEIKAEEFFSIGMAYYEMGQNNTANREYYFKEAEKWLNRARSADRTMTASDYNLGRIAYENGRYEEAAKHFERILSKDPENVMAMKAAAYSRIKNGDLKKAESFYDKILELIPESADDGYNYALVLYGLEKYEKSEEILSNYPHALEENPVCMLLFARIQREQKKVEAIDSFAKWALIANPASAQGRYEYAKVLEEAGLYAKALEQYRAAITAVTAETDAPKKPLLMFEEARLILTADPLNPEGTIKLSSAIKEGFSNQEAIMDLLDDERVTKANKDEIRKILENNPGKQ